MGTLKTDLKIFTHINNTTTRCPHCGVKILVRFNKTTKDSSRIEEFVE